MRFDPDKVFCYIKLSDPEAGLQMQAVTSAQRTVNLVVAWTVALRQVVSQPSSQLKLPGARNSLDTRTSVYSKSTGGVMSELRHLSNR